MSSSIYTLSGFRKFNEELESRWLKFQDKRRERLVQQSRHGKASEKVTEDIIQDFLIIALDWSISNINNQIQYADIVISKNGALKDLIIEAKYPGYLKNMNAIEKVLDQASRYASGQKVDKIAVSDGYIFYVAEVVEGGLKERVVINLDSNKPNPDVFWVSREGIYRTVEKLSEDTVEIGNAPKNTKELDNQDEDMSEELLHPKYKIPARCFAYRGDPLNPNTWKLPCRKIDGTPDTGRLSGAIGALISNYRGAHVTIPEEAVPDALLRLGRSAWDAGKMPEQTRNPADTYREIEKYLNQLGLMDKIRGN